MQCELVMFILCVIGQSVYSYNILVLFPYPGKSHFDSFALLFKTLAQKGHNVTVLSFFPSQQAISNYRDVDIEELEKFNPTLPHMFDIKTTNRKSRLLKYAMIFLLEKLGEMSCEIALSSKSVKDFLQEENKFDVILLEYFNSDCFLTIAKKFNAPVIRLSSCTNMPWTFDRYGVPSNPAYMPNNFLHFSDKMTFFERVENTVFTFLFRSVYGKVFLKNDKRIAMKYFGQLGESLEEETLKDSLLLIATHYSLNLPKPLVPNIIEVGGLHVEKPVALPKDLETWIEESKYGVIYFSFGSVVKGYSMTDEKREEFINVFRKLPQRIIWKWENNTMEGQTDNILIRKWLPQFDILSHPNVKAFISHGGLLGTIEAVHSGVPVLVMPHFGDQHTNAKALEAVGGGEILYLEDATEDKIYELLKKILSLGYQKKAKELSARFRDRPISPLNTAIYWVEYVARHKGAHFMKSAAVGMPFYQYYLLDVIAFVLTILIILLYGLYSLLRLLLRGMYSKKRSKKIKEN